MNIKGYRTILVNMLMALASILAVYNIEITPDQIQNVTAGVFSIWGVVNVILRAITTSRIGQKE